MLEVVQVHHKGFQNRRGNGLGEFSNGALCLFEAAGTDVDLSTFQGELLNDIDADGGRSTGYQGGMIIISGDREIRDKQTN